MKKIIISLICVILSQMSYAQIFTKIRYFDKFDDTLKEETIKTLITKTDSTFIIEEKGRKPQEYFILNKADYNTLGSRDSIVDLTGYNTYGYQNCWCVIKMSDKEEYFRNYIKILRDENLPSKEESHELFGKYWLFIVHRVISRYSSEFEYDREYFWIENELDDNKLGRNVQRIIYTR